MNVVSSVKEHFQNKTAGFDPVGLLVPICRRTQCGFTVVSLCRGCPNFDVRSEGRSGERMTKSMTTCRQCGFKTKPPTPISCPKCGLDLNVVNAQKIGREPLNELSEKSPGKRHWNNWVQPSEKQQAMSKLNLIVRQITIYSFL